MAGIHTIIDNRNISSCVGCMNLNDLMLESYFKIETIAHTNRSLLTITYYDGYPISRWQKEDVYIVIEGMIYNRSKNDIVTELNKIADLYIKDSNYEELVNNFVNYSDGDYIVQIWQKDTGKLLIFNDYFGRLSLYYYCHNGMYIFSREIKVILHFIPKIELSKTSIADYLMFEYPIGYKTIFKNVFRLRPSHVLTLKANESNTFFNSTNSTDYNYILTNPFSNQEKSINILKNKFLESTENRIRTLKDRGYEIIADLSGGYDTRTVLSGLSKFTKDVSYYTFEYMRDESPWAQNVFKGLMSPGQYYKLKIEQNINMNNIGSLIYKTDGLINYYTTCICYKDLQSLKDKFTYKAARISGIGASDFMRKPYKVFHNSLLYGLRNGFYSNQPSIDVICKMINLNTADYIEELRTYLNTWPEKRQDDQLKRLQYEYLLLYQGIAAEDRERMHFWTVQPLWGQELMRSILFNFPIKWGGYKYYAKFMRALDSRLLLSPIYGSKLKLNSQFSIHLYEMKQKNILYIKKNIKLLPLMYRFMFYSKNYIRNIDDSYAKCIAQHFQKLSKNNELFYFCKTKSKVIKLDYKRLLTLLMYLKEVETRYGSKL